jgi:hypothetical protein
VAAAWARLFARNFDARRALFGDGALGRDNIRMVEIARGAGASAKFPGSGGAVVFSLVEALILDGQRRHLGGQQLEQHLQQGLAGLGRSLQGEAAEKLTAFAERQPRLQALGVLP